MRTSEPPHEYEPAFTRFARRAASGCPFSFSGLSPQREAEQLRRGRSARRPAWRRRRGGAPRLWEGFMVIRGLLTAVALTVVSAAQVQAQSAVERGKYLVS